MLTLKMWIRTAVILVFAAVNVVVGGDNNNVCPTSCSCLGNVVDCSRRTLSNVPARLPHWVETLDLSSNDVNNVDTMSFHGLSALTDINLSANRLETFNWSLVTSSPHLTSIKLNHNRIKLITPSLTPLPVTSLHLSHNEITSVRQVALSSLTSLRVCDVTYNKITRVESNSFPFLPQLQQLFLSYNHINLLEQSAFEGLVNLQWLKLNKNRLRSLNKNVFSSLRQLHYLEIERNRIRTIDGLVFQGLDSLISLRLKHNTISELMDGAFWGLNKIHSLDLSLNNISTINKRWLYGLDSLQILNVSHNSISVIESDSWRSCRRLAQLDLQSNQLTSLTDKMFEGLDSLKSLVLSDNQIMFISSSAFHGLSSLQLLDLSENKISWTVEDDSSVFDSLTSLLRLQLQQNQIRSISRRVFSGLHQLRQLNIDNNEVSSIHVGAFESVKQLNDFRLNTSSLLCDCQLSWLVRWIRESNFQSSVDARCGFPQSLAGVNILDIQPEVLTCVNYAKPVIIREPVSVKALRNGNVSLTCEVASSSESQLTVSWRKDNDVLPDDLTEMQVLPPGEIGGDVDRVVYRVLSQLNLLPVVDSHAGRYQCVATNALGSTYSTRAVVTVNVFPTFLKTPLDVTVRAGATAKLDCAAVGTPSPEIALQKNGGDDFPAARERRMHIFPSDEMFFIVDVKPEDQGVYTCTARNDVGTITANATLQVLEAPSFARRMENKSTREGDTAVLECMTSGTPRPRVTWLKDNVNIKPTLRHFFTADDQLLVIVQTEKSDAGAYTCIMTNTLGSDRQTSRLVVLPFNARDRHSAVAADDSAMVTTGIIVIAVVVCVVGTSLVWVLVIYKTRRKSMFKLAGTTFDTSSRTADGLIGSEADGSAQRLLPNYSSLPGHHHSLSHLKFHDTVSEISDNLTVESRHCSACRHNLLSAGFTDDIDDTTLGRICHRRHSCCFVRERGFGGDQLLGDTTVNKSECADSGTHTIGGSLSLGSEDTDSVTLTQQQHCNVDGLMNYVLHQRRLTVEQNFDSERCSIASRFVPGDENGCDTDTINGPKLRTTSVTGGPSTVQPASVVDCSCQCTTATNLSTPSTSSGVNFEPTDLDRRQLTADVLRSHHEPFTSSPNSPNCADIGIFR